MALQDSLPIARFEDYLAETSDEVGSRAAPTMVADGLGKAGSNPMLVDSAYASTEDLMHQHEFLEDFDLEEKFPHVASMAPARLNVHRVGAALEAIMEEEEEEEETDGDGDALIAAFMNERRRRVDFAESAVSVYDDETHDDSDLLDENDHPWEADRFEAEEALNVRGVHEPVASSEPDEAVTSVDESSPRGVQEALTLSEDHESVLLSVDGSSSDLPWPVQSQSRPDFLTDDPPPALLPHGKRGPSGCSKIKSYRPRAYSMASQPPPCPTEAEAAAQIPHLADTKSIIEFWQYPCESHTVETRDGYLLNLDRIPNPQHGFTAYTAPTPYKRPPVIIWHGLCINSAAFVCSPGGTDANLALYLAQQGFDVWLANSRGSFLSRKHAHWPSADEIMFHSRYWNYVGMDEMAKFDVPAVVEYVREVTGWSKVAYLGYSQGTAQMFMSLSLSEEMNEKIAVFVALAPAMKPRPLQNQLLSNATQSLSPSVLFALGCWSALPQAEWLRARVVSEVYAKIIHTSIRLLLGWRNDKFPRAWHSALYTHLYGGGSVKNLVHWFQIITQQTFTPYDHDRTPHVLAGDASSSSESKRDTHISTYAPKRIGPCPYPTHHITTPMMVFCGENDNISENSHYDSAFGKNAHVTIVPEYEHMDFLWAPGARETVWESVVESITRAMVDVDPNEPTERW
ncbi:cholesterol esterase [Thoreauomyces humboldtii]|nr:cholesterol esterase [Thoreauomyces humboldtii]